VSHTTHQAAENQAYLDCRTSHTVCQVALKVDQKEKEKEKEKRNQEEKEKREQQVQVNLKCEAPHQQQADKHCCHKKTQGEEGDQSQKELSLQQLLHSKVTHVSPQDMVCVLQTPCHVA
jgi:hypothetical protein